ncbi:MAG: hypothetical protein ACK4Z4_14515, partial [Ferrovibrio sp.]
LSDGTAPPEDAANLYTPSACPGGRPPHLWVENDTSLLDSFGLGWTLLQLGADGAFAAEMATAARNLRLDLTQVVLGSEQARDLYAADYVLIRPDHIVAWRGQGGDATGILRRLLGYLE